MSENTYTCKHEGCDNEVKINRGTGAYCAVTPAEGGLTHREQFIATFPVKPGNRSKVKADEPLISVHLPNTTESYDLPKRHPLSAMFHDVLAELGILHDKKQLDYGTDGDPFKNVRNSQDFGVAPWIGCMVRANDKMKRIQSFATKGELANESIDDSLKDLAVYSIIALVLLEEERGNL